jgi:chromosome condensin MukBEF MukE localization factor
VTVDLAALPHLSAVFDRLRSGRHLCADDGPLYLALRAEYAAYDAVFSALGFDLVQHERGFFYFQAEAELGKEATQLAVFFFVLVQAWADAGHDIESSAFDPGGFLIAKLPHFSRDSWGEIMSQSGTSNPEELDEVVRRLERYGFAERIGDDRFRFRTPAWRFLDLCRDVWDRFGEPNGNTPIEDGVTT